MGEEALGRGPGEGHEVEEGDSVPEEESGAGETEDGVADGSAGEAEEDGSALADAFDDGFDEETAVEAAEDSDQREGEADGAVGPVIAVVGVDDVDVHEGLLGDVSEEEDGGDGEHGAGCGFAAEEREGTDGVGTLPGKGHAVFAGEGFWQDEEAVESVDEGEDGGDEEGEARVEGAEDSSDGWAEDESHTEGCAEHTEGGGTLLAGRDVGHIGHGGGDAGGGDSGDDASDEEKAEGGSPCHEEVVEA